MYAVHFNLLLALFPIPTPESTGRKNGVDFFPAKDLDVTVVKLSQKYIVLTVPRQKITKKINKLAGTKNPGRPPKSGQLATMMIQPVSYNRKVCHCQVLF